MKINLSGKVVQITSNPLTTWKEWWVLATYGRLLEYKVDFWVNGLLKRWFDGWLFLGISYERDILEDKQPFAEILRFSLDSLRGISCFIISPRKALISLPLYRSKKEATGYMLWTQLLTCFNRVLGHPVKNESVGYYANRQQLEFYLQFLGWILYFPVVTIVPPSRIWFVASENPSFPS